MSAPTKLSPGQGTATTVAAGRRPAGRRWADFGVRWLVFACCLVLWQFAATAGGSPYFPPPLVIGQRMAAMWLSGPPSQLFLSAAVGGDVLPSVARMFAGWAIAGAAGVAIGILLGRSPLALRVCGPLLAFFRAIPPPALLPVFLVLFHIGTPMELATIIFGVIWPTLLNTVDGVRGIDPTKLDTVRVFRLSRVQWVFGVLLPSAAPKIFAGLRISLSLSLILMVISELVGSSNGLGNQLTIAQGDFDLPTMWAVIVLLGLLGYLTNAALLAVEHRVLGWQRAATGR